VTAQLEPHPDFIWGFKLFPAPSLKQRDPLPTTPEFTHLSFFTSCSCSFVRRHDNDPSRRHRLAILLLLSLTSSSSHSFPPHVPPRLALGHGLVNSFTPSPCPHPPFVTLRLPRLQYCCSPCSGGNRAPVVSPRPILILISSLILISLLSRLHGSGPDGDDPDDGPCLN
jgi:hypothetical protein